MDAYTDTGYDVAEEEPTFDPVTDEDLGPEDPEEDDEPEPED